MIGTMESHVLADLRRHVRADQRGIDRSQRIDEQARQDSGDEAERRQQASSRRAKSGRSPLRPRRPGVRGRPRNVTP